MDKQFITDYYYNFKNYKVIITYKHIRNINYRYDKETETFKISSPILTSKRKIFHYLEKFIPSLLKRSDNSKPAITNEYIYIFGNKFNLINEDKTKIEDNNLIYKNKVDLNKYLKKILLEYIKNRITYYYEKMDIKPYKISIRNAKTRLGSNSRATHSLSFSTNLVHYKHDVIDSVIVHELSHDKFYDHSDKFNNYLISIFPDYKNCRRAINHSNYEYGNNH